MREGSAPPAEESASVLKKLQKWGDYAAIGAPVGRFIPCKTPLSKEILSDRTLVPSTPKHALTVEHLLESQRLEGRRVGFIMDLSNHACLYEKDIPEGVRYHHVRLVAKVVPPPDFVAQVRRAVEAFLRERDDEYIAIHCAYGFNRTGFVVCACLCEMEGMSLNEALEVFAKSRPPGVKHEDFLSELERRYGSSRAVLGSSPLSDSQLSTSTALQFGCGNFHQVHAHSQQSTSTTLELGSGKSYQFYTQGPSEGITAAHEAQAPSSLTAQDASNAAGAANNSDNSSSNCNHNTSSSSINNHTSGSSSSINNHTSGSSSSINNHSSSSSIHNNPSPRNALRKSGAELGQMQQSSASLTDPSQPAKPDNLPSHATSPRPASSPISPPQSPLQAPHQYPLLSPPQAQGRYAAPTTSCRPQAKANKSSPHITAASGMGTNASPLSPLSQQRPRSAQHHHHHSHSSGSQQGAHAGHYPSMLRTQHSTAQHSSKGAAHTTPAPLTAEIICSSQWGARACTHPLYSAFRSCAATASCASHTTSIAGSVDGSESMLQSQGGLAKDESQLGGGAKDELQQGGAVEEELLQPHQMQPPQSPLPDFRDLRGQSAGGAESRANQASTAGLVVCGGLPTLQESLPAPLRPRNGGDTELSVAAEDGSSHQGQVLPGGVQGGGDHMRQAPSNASSIGDWLDAYLDQQAVLSQAVTMEGELQEQGNQQDSGTNKPDEGQLGRSVP